MFYHRLFGHTVSAQVVLPAPRAVSVHADISITTTNTHGRLPPTIGDPYSYLRAPDGSIQVTWLDQYEFIVSADGARICARNLGAAHDDALYAYLLTQALSVALLQMGIEGLHGAAIESDDNAFVLLGDCGYGKSTLAAHALMRGARLLTDDLVVFSESSVLPGAQRMKIERNLGNRVLGDRAITPMGEGSEKWIFPLRDDEFAREPVALRAIFVLEPDSNRVALERMKHTDAFKGLLAATFNPLDTTGERLRAHMSFIDALARSTPVFRLSVPRDLTQIDKVLDLALTARD
ncbi:MAG TPA: hypothetical protein VM100_14660 [Longimicrobiales bacterium]|nr:hypothetical protein [Longimicrobiales bacterium]